MTEVVYSSSSENDSPSYRVFTVGITPPGRRGTSEEAVNVYLFLASKEASYVTGALCPVDGGLTVANGPIGKRLKVP